MTRSRQEGFSLPEVMIIVVILAILIAASQIPIANDIQLRRRASLHSGVRDLANWIELVRTRAAQGRVCTVTISNGTVAAGGVVASVAPAVCGANHTLDAEVAAQTGSLAVSRNPATTIVFTTGGGAQPASSVAVEGFNAVEVRLSSNTANRRACLAISNGTGSLRFGSVNSSTGTCTYTGTF